MFDTIDEVQSQLQVGEGTLAEFKEVRLDEHGRFALRPEELAGEMVAFANAEGGGIFFGVDDDGLVQGIPRDWTDDLEKCVISAARDSCDPPIDPIIRKFILPRFNGNDAIIFLVKIRQGYDVHRTTSGHYYKRIGTAEHDLSAVELCRLMQQRSNRFVFDEQIVPNATLDDLDLERLEAHFGSLCEEIFRRSRAVAKVNGELRPTVAGLLAFGRDPSERLYPASISAAVYAGSERTSDDLVDADQIHGCVGHQIDAAISFVARYMKKPARKFVGQTDYPQYDLDAIHEAVINAFIHRDYSILGSRIRVFLYDDRLEIYSPGKPRNALQIEDMEFRVSTRNQLLVHFLSRTRSRRTGRFFLESRGEGVCKILHASEQHSGRRPVYELFGEELRLTIWAQPAPR